VDWSTLITALAQAERAPETQWQQNQSNINTQNSAFDTIKGDLTNLQTDITALQDSTLYSGVAVQSSDSGVATATTASGATLGTYSFNISQLATSAKINGSTDVSRVISPDGDLSTVTVGTAGFSTAITAGTFTINGAQVTVATTDSLQQVFDKIATATNNNVTASYDSTTDEITLASGDNSEIVLGSAADSSNFLQVTKLYNNGSGSVTSAAALGTVQLGGSMSDADLATSITDGGSGAGQFTINGVAINYNAASDSIQNVLDRINSSTAGVTAAYDSVNDRFTLTNKTTGDIGISMQDVTGNFLAATGLSGGTLQHGQNLLYSLNGGSQQLVSQSNTITQASSGINGISVTALQAGSVTVTANSDTSKLSTAIQQFVTDYNSVQNAIASQQIVTTSSANKVTPGALTGDQTANGIASSLRSLITASVPGLSGTISMLSGLGIQTNGQDNTLAVDTDTLNTALSGNLNNVQALFTDPTNGLAVQLNNYLNATIGDDGTLTNHQASLTQQSSDINTQIANLESKITTDTQLWTSEFQAMEQAQSQANQELTYLSQQISSGTI
jgi:flagellar hook-associated protein 2